MPQYQLDYVCCIFFFCQQRGGTLLAVGCGGLFVGVGNSISYTVSRITLFSISITHCCSSLSLSLSLFMYISLSLSYYHYHQQCSVCCVYSECVSAQSTGHSQYILSHSRQQNEQHTIKHKTQTLARRIRKTIQRESNDWRISLAR